MRLLLSSVVTVLLIGIIVSCYAKPVPYFPSEFSCFVNATSPSTRHPVLFRFFYDGINSRTRLDSWGIANEAPPPLYYFIFLYHVHRQLSFMPSVPSYQCINRDLFEDLPPSGPSFTDAVYLGQDNLEDSLCDVWNGTESEFGEYTYYQEVETKLPRRLTSLNVTYDYWQFDASKPELQVFEADIPCPLSPTKYVEFPEEVRLLWPQFFPE